ncbi:hypothetical protein NH340_JMT07778 [Sarcoptes scabiei]|uniref:Glutamyl-tRNA(Gln) amidotransferase subunit A, mitochondrial n=1 Tax=Sarcoptes scabiei TaxID=52283 RepID=A0A132A2K2_SARSC|nr:glutamyl-tRNA(Gln) amidotransferase subunit A, mitochondrial-like protein [Sarcoptes scabiei]UXI21835.1 hypothetical protein NH340_JMT07778 [Sarcoptes scabiei]
MKAVGGREFITNQTIMQIHQLFRSGKLNPIDLYTICQERVVKTKSLNSFITITDKIGLEQAKSSWNRYKKGQPLGLLDGIPISIKDNFNTRSIETTCASKMLRDYISPYNATLTEKLFKAGACLIGKTNMDEFAMGSACSESYFGPTFHPWNSDLDLAYFSKTEMSSILQSEPNTNQNDWFIPGGSSGGSAVSVSVGSAFASLSSDTGGSTRNPASRVGIVGFKPSYGVLSRFGLIPLTNSLDAPSIMTKNIDDTVVFFSSLHGSDVNDSTSISLKVSDKIKPMELRDLIIGVPEEYDSPDLCPSTRKAWKEAQQILMTNGVTIKYISLPHTKYSLPCYLILNCCDVASNFACYDGIEYGNSSEKNEITFEDFYSATREESLNDIVKSRIITGNYFLLKSNYRRFYEKSLKIRRLICDDFEKVFKKIDFILTPVCISPTINYSKWTLKDKTEEAIKDDYCTQPSNMAGLPALSLPFKLDADNHNLPIGMQIIGKKFDDFRLLQFGKRFENLIQFPHLVFPD